MAREPLKFTLDDCDGKSHLYEVPLHRFRPGRTASIGLIAMMGEPLLAAAVGKGLDGSIDASALGDRLNSAAPELLDRIFENATRDGKKLLTEDGVAMDHAYMGNYDEYYQAAWKIIRGNGWLPRLSGLLKKAKAMLAAPTGKEGAKAPA